MPPNDFWLGGGDKYLFFNPDGDDPNDIGAGETFAKGQFGYGSHRKHFSQTNVSAINIINGTLELGGIPSFAFLDNNRFIAQSNSNNITLEATLDFDFGNDWLFWFIKEKLPSVWDTEYKPIYGLEWEEFWKILHPYLLFGFDFNIATNISDIGNILNADMFLFNSTDNTWMNVSQYINVKQEDETLITVSVRDREGKDDILSLMGDGMPYPVGVDHRNYNLTVKFNYTSNYGAVFNVSFNEFTIDVITLDEISPLQIFDPGIQDLFYPISATVDPNTGETIGNPDLDALELNDGNYFIANSIDDNLTIEFEFNLVPYLNNSLWTMDEYEYQYVYPNPTIPEMTLRLSSKVTIKGNSSVQNNLTTAVLEIYVPEEMEWYPVWFEDLLAHENEFQIPARINITNSLFILQMTNSSYQKNSLKFRLRYEWNEAQTPPPGGFNVTIDEFSFDITVQNAKSSDFSSLIGFGYNNDALKPSDISMEVQGTGVADDGTWSGAIANGIPSSDGYFEFNITSRWEAVSFNVTITYNVYKYIIDMDFEKMIKTQYMTGTQYFSVEVNDASGNELEDLELRFELLDSDEKVVDEDTAVTNDEGVAKGSLDFDEVGEGYTIKVSFEEDSIYATDDVESDEFRIVDETTIFIDNLLFLLPYILIAVAGISIFVVVRHRKMSRLREFWGNEAQILEDLLKISYILIIHKEAGVTIYSKQISMELDSDLIGGFITAISQFRSEIKKSKDLPTKHEGFEMDYYDFKIVIIDGDFVRVALILDGTPSKNLEEDQEAFTKRFEQKFSPLLKDFTGDVRAFSEADQLIEKFFNISFMYPFQLSQNWERIKYNKLERALVEVANQMQKERKYIFISSLLSYGIAGRKESKNQIISTIIGLKRRGLLVPVEFT